MSDASPYLSVDRLRAIPRLPLEGHLDLTYRCNNACRHCWLWLAPNASQQADELSFDEIRSIADQARALGTRQWSISGGEPMLRADFAEIFDTSPAKPPAIRSTPTARSSRRRSRNCSRAKGRR